MSISHIVEEINNLSGKDIVHIENNSNTLIVSIKGYGVIPRDCDQYEVLDILRCLLQEVKHAKA